VQIAVLEESDEAKAQGNDKADWDHFWHSLGGKTAIAAHDAASDQTVKTVKQIFKVSDASGKLLFTEVAFKRTSLLEDDAFVVSTGPLVFVWVGKSANANEKKQSLNFAQKYLNEHPDLPKTTPIVRVLSGAENDEFFSYF